MGIAINTLSDIESIANKLSGPAREVEARPRVGVGVRFHPVECPVQGVDALLFRPVVRTVHLFKDQGVPFLGAASRAARPQPDAPRA